MIGALAALTSWRTKEDCMIDSKDIKLGAYAGLTGGAVFGVMMAIMVGDPSAEPVGTAWSQRRPPSTHTSQFSWRGDDLAGIDRRFDLYLLAVVRKQKRGESSEPAFCSLKTPDSLGDIKQAQECGCNDRCPRRTH